MRPEDLPKRCFVSHSYDDGALVEKLRRSVPHDIELVKFPQAEPDPRKPVSSAIIPTILDCPGLIYLTSDASRESFWVRFERDYALRAGRKVFAYNPKTGSLRPDRSQPMPLALTVIFHGSDEDRVRRLISWMANERHFVIGESSLRSTLGGFTGDILVGMEELLVRGGVVLWLLGAMSVKVAEAFYSDEFVDYLLESESDTLEDMWKDCLAEKHEEDGDDDWVYDGEDEYFNERENSSYSKTNFIESLYGNIHEVIARINPGLSAKWRLLPWAAAEILAESPNFDPGAEYRMIDLYARTDGRDFNWNRVDELIIELYKRLDP